MALCFGIGVIDRNKRIPTNQPTVKTHNGRAKKNPPSPDFHPSDPSRWLLSCLSLDSSDRQLRWLRADGRRETTPAIRPRLELISCPFFCENPDPLWRLSQRLQRARGFGLENCCQPELLTESAAFSPFPPPPIGCVSRSFDQRVTPRNRLSRESLGIQNSRCRSRPQRTSRHLRADLGAVRFSSPVQFGTLSSRSRL